MVRTSLVLLAAFSAAFLLPAGAQSISSGAAIRFGASLGPAASSTPTASTPVASPGAGSYSSSQSVALTTSTPGASIYYTTDGSTPTCSSAPYSGHITVSSSLTIRAIACLSGYMPSGILSAAYTIGPITFSPPGGHYTSAQTVTIGCPSGYTCFYTVDGSTPNPASKKYTSPISVAANTTINAIGVVAGSVSQNTISSGASWKCNTVSGGTSNGVTCNAVGTSGGIGSIQPSAWNMTFGSTAQFLTSTTASSSETQQLFVYSGAACDSCTAMAEDFWEQPVGDHTINANLESDMYHVDATHQIGGQPVLHMFGLQCNQQPGNPGYGHWQIDNEQGSWINTSVTAACPLPTTAYTHVALTGHWTLGDTGCGGYGCTYFDTLTINGVVYTLNTSLESYVESWSHVTGHQYQNDLTNTSTSGQNPTNGGRTVQASNVTAWSGSSVNGSAAYTF